MRYTYDSEADAAYVFLADEDPPKRVAKSRVCDVRFNGGAIVFDLDENGHLMGIEILGARNVLPEFSEILGNHGGTTPRGSAAQ